MINFSNFEPDYVKDYYQFIINKLQSINTSEDYTVIGLSDLDRSLSEIFDRMGSDKGTYFTHVGQTQNIAHYYTIV